MAISVPEVRIDLDSNEVEITRGVRALHWVNAAVQQQWLSGRGSMDVPAHAPGAGVATSTTSAFRYWTKPRRETLRYALTLVLTTGYGTTSPPSQGSCTVAIPSGGTPHNVAVSWHDRAVPVTLLFDRVEGSSVENEISFDITANATTNVTIESVAIEAVPRTLLGDDDDPAYLITHAGERLITHAGDYLVTHPGELAVDRSLFWARQPIMEPSLASALLHRQNDLRDACRRTGMFQFSRGTGNPWLITTASPSWAALFVDAIALLGRAIYSGDTTRTLSWRVLAKCSDGSTAGQVRVSNTSGGAAVSTITIPAGTTAWTWLPATSGAAATFACDCENNTVVDGRRSARWDDHTFEANRTAGAGSVQIASLSVFEA